jgi:hypothetical protein
MLALVRGGVTALALVFCASMGADFFAEPRLRNVLYAPALACLMDGFINIGVVDFRAFAQGHGRIAR